MPNYWFDHIHLMSPDPLKTAEFYEKSFGWVFGNNHFNPRRRVFSTHLKHYFRGYLDERWAR